MTASHLLLLNGIMSFGLPVRSAASSFTVRTMPADNVAGPELMPVPPVASEVRALGTLIVLSAADKIIDLGPGGGAKGGQIVAQFSPKNAINFVLDWSISQ